MKQIEVTIMGQSYLLGCPEGREAALRQAVAQVDVEMCGIRDAGKVKARERIAVLAALNLAFQLTEPASGQAASDGSHAPDAPALDSKAIQHLIDRIDGALSEGGQLI